MSKPETITIDNVKYVRADSIPAQPVEYGEKRIVIADRGWVFVGDCTDQPEGLVKITNTKNIRRWGTTKGLGELITGPTSETIIDDYGTVVTKPIAQIAVIKGW